MVGAAAAAATPQFQTFLMQVRRAVKRFATICIWTLCISETASVLLEAAQRVFTVSWFTHSSRNRKMNIENFDTVEYFHNISRIVNMF